MADEVPKWLVAAYRKHLKREAAKEIEFRSALERKVKEFNLNVRRGVPMRQSTWTAWVARYMSLWRSQGYDQRTMEQLLRENLQRAFATAVRRGDGAMTYHRQRQDGGFL